MSSMSYSFREKKWSQLTRIYLLEKDCNVSVFYIVILPIERANIVSYSSGRAQITQMDEKTIIFAPDFDWQFYELIICMI